MNSVVAESSVITKSILPALLLVVIALVRLLYLMWTVETSHARCAPLDCTPAIPQTGDVLRVSPRCTPCLSSCSCFLCRR